jgi:exonuclease III
MSILAWNCQGLGNPQTVRILHRLVKDKRPHLVFLIETKCMQAKASFLKIKLDYDSVFAVDCKGLSGGLILLWKSTYQTSY